MSTTSNDLKTLQTQVQGLQKDIKDANERLDATQQLLDETRNDLKIKSETVEKLDKKYEKEEELKRCLLLIDGVNEHGNKKPTAVVEMT